MIYAVLFYITLGYLVIAFLVAVYLVKELRRQIPKIEKTGEIASIALGAYTVALLWPVWLVKCFIIGFVYVTKGDPR